MAENTETKAPKEKKHYFQNLKAEFKKIIWPDKKSVAKQTGAVVMWSVVIGVMIAVLDTIVKFALGFIL